MRSRPLRRSVRPGALLGAVLLLFTAGAAGASAAPARTASTALYVSPSATNVAADGADCSPLRPCSLPRAQRVVRGKTGHMRSDIVVYLRGGTYRLAAPLRFGASDSGTGGHTVTYAAFPGERPVLSGARKVGGWSLSDPAGNIWSAPVPAGLNTRQLYLNGERLPRASGQAPAALKQTADGFTAASADMASWRNPRNIEFVFTGGVDAWAEPRCDVAGISGDAITMRQPCWGNVHVPEDRNSTGYDNPPMGGFGGIAADQTPSYVENAYELLSAGHWYLDTTAHRIYYIPREGENVRSADFEAPVLQSLVDGAGTDGHPVHDLAFSGIQFSYATWLRPSGDDGFAELQANFTLTGKDAAEQEGTCGYVTGPPKGTCPFAGWDKTPAAVDFRWSDQVRFDGDTFDHLGGAGLGLASGAHRNAVVGNTFTDISGSAVQLGDTHDPTPAAVGAGPEEMSTDNRIADNLIHDVAVEYHGGVGIWVGYTRGTTITHNQISDLPYTGITMGWGGWHTDVNHPDDNPNINADNSIDHNLIVNVMQFLHDGGAIYTNGPQGKELGHGLSLKGNVAINAANANNAFYDDEGSDYMEISGNVQYHDLLGSYGSAAGTGGCSALGHLRVSGNYFAQPYPQYQCDQPIDVVLTDNHTIGDTPAPGDVPDSVLASAGLDSAHRALVTRTAPVLSQVGPTAGSPAGGTSVLVAGSGFTGGTRVSFGGHASSQVRVLSANYLIAKAPAGSGTVDVMVRTGFGPSAAVAGDRFTYQVPAAR
jgi:hypothetical protein